MSHRSTLLSTSACLLCSLAILAVGAGEARAENGAVGYARPADGIVIDGDLGDWPADAVEHPITNAVFGSADNWRDRAVFRAAYDPSGEYLYLAVTVADASGVDLPEGGPSDEDTLMVYVDADHHWRGSGSWAFRGEIGRVSNASDPLGWDPQAARASDDDAVMAVVQEDDQRIYEWRIRLDQPVRAGMSIGLDMVLLDVDEAEHENPTAAIGWGKYGNKTGRASRLGDLVLLDAGEQLGTLTGDLVWADGVEGPGLGGYRVRIRDRRDPELWITVESDDAGAFRAKLPSGHYCVTPNLMLVGPEAEFRISENSEVCAQVEVGSEAIAGTLMQEVREVPDHHIRQNGFLIGFDALAAERLDAFMADYMDHYTIPGASVVIINNNDIVYSKDYGVTNWLTQEPVAPESLFDMGSITKVIFAFAVHRLVEQGVLDLDRELHEYLPFDDIAHDERSRLFTARYVLSHQTGLPNWRWQNEDRQLDIAFTPGEGYRYSGEGYDYLGRVIEHLTGEDLEAVLMREAVVPLGMSSAVRFTKRGDWHNRFVIGHSERRGFESPTPDEAHAAYSMMASTNDIAQALITWMERGGGLSQAGYGEMFEPQVETGDTATGTAWPVSHAVGPRVIETPFGRAIGHGGLNWGQVALMEMYEDEGVGFVVATNGDDGMHVRNALRRFLMAGQEHSVDPGADD